MRRGAVCIAAVAVGALSGCHAHTETVVTGHHSNGAIPTTTGRITGTLRIVGGPYPGLNHAVAGNVVATPVGSTSGAAAAHTTATKQGFAFALPPGRYRLSGGSIGGTTPCQDRGIVTVTRDQTTHANIVCDVP
jgi:hypothetical protein